MNPTPTDKQWLVLYQIDEQEVVPDGPGRWKAKGSIGWFQVTGSVQRLYVLGLINLDDHGRPSVNPEGEQVLKRRSVYEVLERINRRRGESSG